MTRDKERTAVSGVGVGPRACGPPPLCVAGRPVAAQLRARAPALTSRVVDRLLSDLPVYAELPHEEIAGDIADIVQHNLRLFADVVEHRRPATDAELAQQRDSAAQRAEEGVPLDAILTAYQVGIAMCWQETARDAGPADLPAVLEIMDRIMVLQQQLTSAVSGAYLEARQILDSQEHGGRHALMAALLTGESLELLTQRTGLRPAAGYLTMTLALAPHPDEVGQAPGPGTGVAARRKIRRIRTALDRFSRHARADRARRLRRHGPAARRGAAAVGRARRAARADRRGDFGGRGARHGRGRDRRTGGGPGRRGP